MKLDSKEFQKLKNAVADHKQISRMLGDSLLTVVKKLQNMPFKKSPEESESIKELLIFLSREVSEFQDMYAEIQSKIKQGAGL